MLDGLIISRSEDGSSGKKLAHSGMGSPDGDSSSGESQDEKPSLIDSGFLSHHHHHHQLGLNHTPKSSPSGLNIFSQHQMVRFNTYQPSLR